MGYSSGDVKDDGLGKIIINKSFKKRGTKEFQVKKRKNKMDKYKIDLRG